MVALVGAPNVGKSSLVRVLSSGTPEVSNYPFTTRGIKMGHLFIENDRVLVTDTPGLLWRPVWTREHTEHFNTLHFKVQAENLKFEI
jgi:nucleolar GTP-binding protein